jgi:asparagine synthase (glutamine-hydrolysing)
MCGILALTWKDEKTINKLIKTLQHRGPDHTSTKTTTISLGHTRLAIIDLDKRSNQPMTAFGKTIIFNGEIYNYEEIKNELSEYKFKTTSDTEVILAAYDKWKEKCLDKFNGMFTFIIQDKKELFIARDRFGIKPLYYAKTDKGYAFSSELKTLLPLVKKEIDTEALSEFFTFRYSLGEKTMIKQIKTFLPGHYMILGKKTEYKKYYEIKVKKTKTSKKTVRELLEKSVARRMVSDVPVSTFLSGGLDSSILTTLAKKHNNKLNTFSIGFDKTSELSYAKIVSKHLKTKHYETKINSNSMLSYVDKMVFHMDEPIGGDPGFLPLYILSKNTVDHNKVVLTGDGADELFAGYDKYKLLKYGQKIKHFALTDLNNDILRRLKNMRGKTDYQSYKEIIRLFDSKEMKKLGIKEADAKQYWKKTNDIVTSAQLFDFQTLLPRDFFMKVDKMTSAHGLEARVPFLDHELVEYVFSIPSKYKLSTWKEKKILRESFKEILPKAITKRRKHGFDVPVYYWFKKELGEELKALLDRSKHKLYDKKYAYELLEKNKHSSNNRKLSFYIGAKLWSFLVFEKWYEQNIQ